VDVTDVEQICRCSVTLALANGVQAEQARKTMFEKFTDRARRVVVLAQEEARMLNHDYIGTEHILLGLIHEGEGAAAKALNGIGISLEQVRQQVEEIIGTGRISPSGQIPFTPRAKKVLELSYREALHLRHNYIGTEHILLGLLREGDGVAAQVLVKLGADLDRVRQQVIALLSAGQHNEDISGYEEATTPPFVAGPTLLGEILSILRDIARRVEKIERHLSRTDDDQPDG
jgi:ATP-dependent Clp protease ATP-binding subunit ClpC